MLKPFRKIIWGGTSLRILGSFSIAELVLAQISLNDIHFFSLKPILVTLCIKYLCPLLLKMILIIILLILLGLCWVVPSRKEAENIFSESA